MYGRAFLNKHSFLGWEADVSASRTQEMVTCEEMRSFLSCFFFAQPEAQLPAGNDPSVPGGVRSVFLALARATFVGLGAGSVRLVHTGSAHAGTFFLRVVCSDLILRVS